MVTIDRRRFCQLTGVGAGAVLATGVLPRQLGAGEPMQGAALFEKSFGVTKEVMSKVLQAALSKGGSFADLFFEHTTKNLVIMEDGLVSESDEEILLGVGIRVLKDQQTGFGFTSTLTPEAMQQAALTAAAIADGQGSDRCTRALREVRPGQQVYRLERPLADASLTDRLAMVEAGYKAATGHDPRIKKAVVSLFDSLQHVTIANSDGLVVSDTRPQVRLRIKATAEQGGTRVTGDHNAGGRVGRELYEQPDTTPKEIGVRAAEEALIMLGAIDPKPGDQPVVCGCNSSGVMVHEAVGHPFEGDGVWRKSSIMWDRHGEMVANPLVTIYDDATIPFFRGSLNIDDEGTPTRKVVMVQKGRLTSFLHDRLSAGLLGFYATGHGRRQTFRDIPQPRMCNTVLAPGESAPEEIIRSVKRGFFAESYQGGMVQGTGKFTFSVSLGYLIENGKLTAPVRNATLIGSNLQILKEIDMVGSDLGFFLGTCGKRNQQVAVTAGTPTFRIREMTVGGRA